MKKIAPRPPAVPEIYLRTLRTVKEEANGEGEVTYYIESEICEDTVNWKPCLIIWSDRRTS